MFYFHLLEGVNTQVLSDCFQASDSSAARLKNVSISPPHWFNLPIESRSIYAPIIIHKDQPISLVSYLIVPVFNYIFTVIHFLFFVLLVSKHQIKSNFI